GHAPDGLSHARLVAAVDGREVVVSTEPNTLVLFEGAVVRHKVTPIRAAERRVVLSMTCCSDPRAQAWQGIARRFKDTAYYGVRALWTGGRWRWTAKRQLRRFWAAPSANGSPRRRCTIPSRRRSIPNCASACAASACQSCAGRPPSESCTRSTTPAPSPGR